MCTYPRRGCGARTSAMQSSAAWPLGTLPILVQATKQLNSLIYYAGDNDKLPRLGSSCHQFVSRLLAFLVGVVGHPCMVDDVPCARFVLRASWAAAATFAGGSVVLAFLSRRPRVVVVPRLCVCLLIVDRDGCAIDSLDKEIRAVPSTSGRSAISCQMVLNSGLTTSYSRTGAQMDSPPKLHRTYV